MKKILMLIVLLSLKGDAYPAYFKTFIQNPSKPQISGGATFDTSFRSNGGLSMLAIVYHEADRNDTLIPQSLLDIGVEPISWSLLNVGVGQSGRSFTIPVGLSVNLTPTILGPLLRIMSSSENEEIRAWSLFFNSNRGGVAFGPTWTAHPYEDGSAKPLNRWRFVPGYFLGGLWRF